MPEDSACGRSRTTHRSYKECLSLIPQMGVISHVRSHDCRSHSQKNSSADQDVIIAVISHRGMKRDLFGCCGIASRNHPLPIYEAVRAILPIGVDRRSRSTRAPERITSSCPREGEDRSAGKSTLNTVIVGIVADIRWVMSRRCGSWTDPGQTTLLSVQITSFWGKLGQQVLDDLPQRASADTRVFLPGIARRHRQDLNIAEKRVISI